MPIKTVLYKCEYGCGTQALYSEDQMKYHEEHCPLNPDTKQCPTCKHYIEFPDNIKNSCCSKGKLPVGYYYTTDCKHWEKEIEY